MAETITDATYLEIARLRINPGREVVVLSSELPMRPAALQLELRREPAPPLRITIPGRLVGELLAAIAAWQARAAAVERAHQALPQGAHRPGVPRGRAV